MTQTAPLLRGGNRFDYIYAALVTALPCCAKGKDSPTSFRSYELVKTCLQNFRKFSIFVESIS